ncbi:hypothetical protein DQ238_07495 [Geodermatophilus sp. TF02-6]|uniref:protein kinase family protein n=1 Tax=Geodermatophilus sp. TF02-6 TaxID=2250575 RepID=UPI000DEB603D|nr:protein kinase family protein [Geodermatophilus sp. TF02-6]RBY80878.1 hypothetical protein DQ238_07495 [Geodermatophilus sp. TF02-6]
MTSTTTGLPDRYRPLDEVGPAETTATGAIRCWRARDRILDRDVAVRVHTPGGPPAREWIGRALTAGGLATPALAMVYDAAEGDGRAPGGAAYVVNEWIEGQALAERLAEGPMPEREVRTVMRRLAEGVADAHRAGLAVGGISPETVVLRPGGLVGLRSVPAAHGSVQGDIAALGELLEHCLTGHRAGATPLPDTGRRTGIAPDLAALVRRARSTEPGTRLSSASAMAALLAERPRTAPVREPDESDSGWLRRLRERREEDVAAEPAPSGSTVFHGNRPAPVTADDGDEDDLLPFAAADDDPDPEEDAGGAPPPGRRRLLVVGLPLLALLVVVALAWYVGNNVLSVAGTGSAADDPPTTAPSTDAPAAPTTTAAPSAGPLAVTGASVFNPYGDGDPENEDDVDLSHDGDPASAWSTVTYRGSAAFGNLKPGVGVRYDLGGDQRLAGVTVTTTTPGIAVEVRTGNDPGVSLDGYAVDASGTVDGTAELTFDQPVTARYVLVWITSLAPADGGFAGDLAEVTPIRAG